MPSWQTIQRDDEECTLYWFSAVPQVVAITGDKFQTGDYGVAEVKVIFNDITKR